MTKIEFISEMATAYKKAAAKRKFIMPASVTIAMACCESAFGQSSIMRKNNAYFGFKVGNGHRYGTDWNGRSFNTKTKEYYSGYVTIRDNFRSYDTMEECIGDFLDLISGLSRYKKAVGEKDPKKCITAIKNGGYCTSPTYITTIMNIIKTYNLKRYDNMDSKTQDTGKWYAAVSGIFATQKEAEVFQEKAKKQGIITKLYAIEKTGITEL